MPLRSRRRPSPGTALGFIALFIALGGTALAASGQLIHIGDPVNARHVARVDSTGALKTLTLPERTFFDTSRISDSTYKYGLFKPTMATIAINRIVIGEQYGWTAGVRHVIIYYATVNAGQPCQHGAQGLVVKELGVYSTQNSTTVVDNPSPPLVFKPSGTQPWCLMVHDVPKDQGTSGYATISVSGFVVSGSPPADI